MAESQYRTSPEPIATMPSGIPFIVGNEAAERFSYYGMRAILMPFMTKFLLDSAGQKAPMTSEEAGAVAHTFMSAVYFFPLLGALISDGFFGKYRTIIALSLVYCFGHLALALDETRFGLLAGLTLIAVGAGGIKPCVSAHVGDQFGEQNKHLIPKVFNWFYFAINFGAFYSTLITPAILNRKGRFADWIPEGVSTSSLAFGLPGILMFLATIVFWLGRKRYAHVPAGGSKFLEQTFSREGLSVVLRLGALYFFIAFFWCLYDQTATSWVTQSEKLDRHSPLLSRILQIASLGLLDVGEDVSAESVQSANPLLIMLMIPLFQFAIYPALNSVFKLTPLRKVGIGMLLTVGSFVLMYAIELRLAEGERVSFWWQVLAFVIITAGEVMVSITVLEYSYTQAPPTMKSFVMSLYMLSVSLGNLIAAAVNALISTGAVAAYLKGPNYFLFFAGLLMFTTTIYIFVSRKFPEKTYVQQ